MCVKRLDNRSPSGHQANFIADRERGLQAVILDADLATLGRHAVPGTLDFSQTFPAVGFDRPAIALANQVVLLERDDCASCILVQIVLDQLGDQIIAVKIEKVVPEARNPVGFGDELTFIGICAVGSYVHDLVTGSATVLFHWGRRAGGRGPGGFLFESGRRSAYRGLGAWALSGLQSFPPHGVAQRLRFGAEGNVPSL